MGEGDVGCDHRVTCQDNAEDHQQPSPVEKGQKEEEKDVVDVDHDEIFDHELVDCHVCALMDLGYYEAYQDTNKLRNKNRQVSSPVIAVIISRRTADFLPNRKYEAAMEKRVERGTAISQGRTLEGKERGTDVLTR